MRAALMERGRIWVDEIEEPKPRRGEVLVKTCACGICGSDLHAMKYTEEFVATSRETGGAFKLTTMDPVVLGHEFSAEIVEFGLGCKQRLAPGTLVCSVPMLKRQDGLPIGYSPCAPGGFAEYMVLSESFLLPVPEGTPAAVAALTEPIAVGLHAVNKARLTGTETVIVVGCGPVGLAVVTALRARHRGQVIASDYSESRRTLALRQGAHSVIDPSVADPFELPPGTRGENVVVFECVGTVGMIDHLFVKSPANARIVVVGVCLRTDQSRPLIAINKELNVQYVLGYSFDEFKETLKLISDGDYDVADLITKQVPLSGLSAAFESLQNPNADGKIVVTHS